MPENNMLLLRGCFCVVTCMLCQHNVVADVFTEITDCGGFVEIMLPLESGTIQSPYYPQEYLNGRHCIWFFEAPVNYSMVLDIPSVTGQDDGFGACVDYLEVRNGSGTSELMYLECYATSSSTVQSSSRWMWVKWRADDLHVNKGFKAIWSTIYAPGNQDDVTPAPSCRSLSFRCPNKECISRAYICDGFEDCGCRGKGCEEMDCGGIGWSRAQKNLVGFTLGILIFLIVFFGSGALNKYMRYRSIRNTQKRIALHEKLMKQKRAQKAVENMFGGSSRLEVPGSSMGSKSLSRSTSKTSMSTNGRIPSSVDMKPM